MAIAHAQKIVPKKGFSKSRKPIETNTKNIRNVRVSTLLYMKVNPYWRKG